jgi:hypothetical protein
MLMPHTGTEAQVDALVDRLQLDLAILSNSLDVFKLDAGLRDKVAHALLPLTEPEVRAF